MAKEIKTLKVIPANEARTIRAYQCFGWKLLNNQEVYSKDSHLDSGWSVTETVHYVKLTFERDPATLKYYDELRRLENMYYSVPAPPKRPKDLGAFAVGIRISCIITALITLIFDFMTALCIVVIPELILQWMKKKRQDKIAAWEAVNRKFWEEREHILQQTDRYL